MTVADPPPPTRRALRTGAVRLPAEPRPDVELAFPDDASALPARIAAAALGDADRDAAENDAASPAAAGPAAASSADPSPAPAAAPSADPAPSSPAGPALSPAEPEPTPADIPAPPEREHGPDETRTEPRDPDAHADLDEVSRPEAAASVPVVVPPADPPLAWVDERALTARSARVLQLESGAPAFLPVTADLLSRAPRRTAMRPGVLVPFGVFLAVIVAYCATTLLWPLHAVAPTVAQIAVQPVPAPAAVGAWPAEGGAATVVAGVGAPIASTGDAMSIASITKVVTSLLVLEEMPLAPGEAGREFRFTSADRSDYWRYRDRGESALDVPVGGSLTEYQMLQGVLMGSANNYADRLASTIWPNDEVFARAANTWLAQHGIDGITITDPTGIDFGNIASPEALLTLGERALAHPVIAEIVRTPEVELPGVGLVRNSNPLLADPGVVGIKTGSLDTYNLLAAKDVTVGETTVRIYGAMLGQPDREVRDEALRAVFAQVEQELQLRPSVPEGTVVGQVQTKWGEAVPILAAADAQVVLWNGGAASVETTFHLGDLRDEGDVVGALVATGPKDAASVDLVLAGDVDDPSPFWRLTHPLQLFGLV